MPHDKTDTVVDDFIGHGHRLLRITGVIISGGFEHAAIDATGFIDLLNGH